MVDFGAIRIISIDEFYLGSELFKYSFIDGASGTVGAIHVNVEVGKIDTFEMLA